MTPRTILIVAGDPSGDLAAAELVQALRAAAGNVPPRFIGAGGPAMAAAGVEISFELTRHSVIGIEILHRLRFFRRVFYGLLDLARAEVPDLVVGVDYAGFNLRFATAVRRAAKSQRGSFCNWHPRLVQYVSPQVWASRPGRAQRMARTHDLLLSILPFEPAWYAQHAPGLRVEFIGHPIVERHAAAGPVGEAPEPAGMLPTLLLLPGSRPGELQRHLPVMVPAAKQIAAEAGAELRLVLPREELRAVAEPFIRDLPRLQVQSGGLDEALRTATVALASTGTVTLECAWYGVPTVALYRTSRLTYEIGRRIITVRHLAMPNLLAGETVMPEFIQDAATPAALAGACLELLRDPARRTVIRAKLREVVKSLGPPGAAGRGAKAILNLSR